jgi:hypothetical protein
MYLLDYWDCDTTICHIVINCLCCMLLYGKWPVYFFYICMQILKTIFYVMCNNALYSWNGCRVIIKMHLIDGVLLHFVGTISYKFPEFTKSGVSPELFPYIPLPFGTVLNLQKLDFVILYINYCQVYKWNERDYDLSKNIGRSDMYTNRIYIYYVVYHFSILPTFCVLRRNMY